MLLLLERKNKSSTRPPSTSGQKSFVKRKDDHWLPFLFFPRYFGLTLNFNWSFVFFFFILGLGWVVVWCRHELVFVIDQSSHLCNPCSPSEEAKSEGKNWKLKNIFQKLKNLFFSKTSDLQSWPRKVDAMQPRRRREQPPDVLAADPAVDPLSKILLG